MKNCKLTIEGSWLDSVIESLQDPEEAAGYLSIVLQGNSKTDLALQNALQDVVEAFSNVNNLSEEAQLHYHNLEKIFSEGGGSEIVSLVGLLKALGFRLVVAPKKMN